MAKKKPKKATHKRRARYRENAATEVKKIDKLEYTKVTCKYLPNIDAFQVFLDMKLNGVHLKMLGNIDPDHSYDKGIRIFTKCPQPWMTCTEVNLTRAHAPGIFCALLAYCNTVGDLLDGDVPANEIPRASAYLDGAKFSDKLLPELFEKSLSVKIIVEK